MTTTAFDDQFTDAPSELVRQPYDTGSILRRNVADLELALKQQTERAEAAEAELAMLRKQEPVAWMLECQQWTGDTAWLLSWSKSGAGQCNRLDGESHQRALYERPIPMERIDSIPAPATAATAVPEEWRKFVGFLAQQTTSPHPAVCICQACTWIKKARALLQSRDLKDSLTSQADCRACVNRGRDHDTRRAAAVALAATLAAEVDRLNETIAKLAAEGQDAHEMRGG